MIMNDTSYKGRQSSERKVTAECLTQCSTADCVKTCGIPRKYYVRVLAEKRAGLMKKTMGIWEEDGFIWTVSNLGGGNLGRNLLSVSITHAERREGFSSVKLQINNTRPCGFGSVRTMVPMPRLYGLRLLDHIHGSITNWATVVKKVINRKTIS